MPDDHVGIEARRDRALPTQTVQLGRIRSRDFHKFLRCNPAGDDASGEKQGQPGLQSGQSIRDAPELALRPGAIQAHLFAIRVVIFRRSVIRRNDRKRAIRDSLPNGFQIGRVLAERRRADAFGT